MIARRPAKALLDPADNLAPALPKQDIACQAYHRRAFVGNHIDKALLEKVIHESGLASLNVVSNCQPALSQEAEAIHQCYQELFSVYATCRGLYYHSYETSAFLQSADPAVTVGAHHT